MICNTFIFLLMAVPILPKVGILQIAGIPILLDDLVLILATAGLAGGSILESSVSGSLRLYLTPVGLLFLGLILFKFADLGLLSLIYPWTDLTNLGVGVYVGEGVLVMGKTFIFFLVYVLIYTSLRDRENVHTVLNFYIFIVFIVVAIGVFQFVALGHGVLTSTFRHIYALNEMGDRLGVSNPWIDRSAVGHEHLGAYMVIAASIVGSMVLARWPADGWKRLYLTLLWFGCMFTLVLSSSRGAWIGGVCALAVMTWFAFRRGKMIRLLGGLLGGICLFAAVQAWSGMNIIEYIEGRVVDLLAIFSGQILDDSAQQRISTLQAQGRIFANYPLLGLGPGGAGRIAEGQFMRELIEGGIVGGFLFLLVMFTCGRMALRSYRLSDDRLVQGVSLGFVCSLVGMFGQSFFTELFLLTKIGVTFWVLAAVVHRLCVLNLAEKDAGAMVGR